MGLAESGEMYLETIYVLTRHSTSVRSIDVAHQTGYSKPSVSRAMGLLRSAGHIEIDENGDNLENAVVPDSMLGDYGVDFAETLTDASGKQYQVGERESRWGITGKQFTIYVLIIVAAIVLIVTGTMITVNRINRSKAKYAAMTESDDGAYDIDEEELRLQIMQEMLEEAKRKNNGE